YYDWNLELQSGMFTMIHSNKENIVNHSYKNQKLLHKEVEEVTQKAEKLPQDVSSYLLDQRTLLIIREGIMVNVEKELVQLGFEENLTLAKRNLEKRLLREHSQSLEVILDSKVTDILVAWDFHKDKSTILLILNPTS
ncbi:Na-translocating system protein MpsC family protein, partial [Priestia megaterium]|uniref:Na-translocating system protein MpsC family protein n=5 Tax=Bacillaceae TaxID=186817 RepID=UPI002FFFB2EF